VTDLGDDRRITEDALGQNLYAVSDHGNDPVKIQRFEPERGASAIYSFHNIRSCIEERPVEIKDDDLY